MPKYLLSYHGGHFPPELADETGRNWTIWMASVGDVFVDRGGPLETAQTISTGGMVSDTGANETTGYSIIEAPNIGAAIEIAKGCPQLEAPHVNGTIEVAELIVM